MTVRNTINDFLKENSLKNLKREELISEILTNKEAIASNCGALATWTPIESTGRSPKDTLIVKRKEIENFIDWSSPNNLPIDIETYEMILNDSLKTLSKKGNIYFSDRAIGADSNYELKVKTISDSALTQLFTHNMFRPASNDNKSIFSDNEFYLIVLPYEKLDKKKYSDRLRKLPDNSTSDMAIIMDFYKRIGIVYGSAYCGSVKKLMFTVMNYMLPENNILPLHCSANESKDGKHTAVFLGLSGTGKTTLSADPERVLIGDDEHGWDDNGIANFEYGCYAKLINLNKKKEPDIYQACFHDDSVKNHGVIIENAMFYPNGEFDLDDDRITPNSRASYPLSYLENHKPNSKSGHADTIIFLTADANGVLPPISKLTPEQAMLWFLMGYTSKLAGTETGIVEPVSTFSRFFGQPFMPRNPSDYAELLGEKMRKYKTHAYLINTGWSGGPYGVGKRMDINLTRAVVRAALSGEINNSEFIEDKLFHLNIPTTCQGVDSLVLVPKNTWQDKSEYEKRALKLANEFSEYFDKAYSNANISEKIKSQCPGK
jgi:phosphoenolpyruvate carboxykinase (ATP)